MFGIDDIIGAGLGIINKFIPDENQRAQAAAAYRAAVLDAQAKAEQGQLQIDQAEAGNPSMFVAGWRPAVGWLCVFTLAYTWILVPLINWGFAVIAVTAGHDLTSVVALPTLGAIDSQTLLYALLGIGTLRTVDKMSGNDTMGIGGIISSAVKKVTGR